MLPTALNCWCLWIITSFTERFSLCVTLPWQIRGRQWAMLQSMCCKSHTHTQGRRCHSDIQTSAGVMLMQLPSNPTDCAFGTLLHYWKYIFCDEALFGLSTRPIVTLLVVKSCLWRKLEISRSCDSFIAWFCLVKGSMCWHFDVGLVCIQLWADDRWEAATKPWMFITKNLQPDTLRSLECSVYNGGIN